MLRGSGVASPRQERRLRGGGPGSAPMMPRATCVVTRPATMRPSGESMAAEEREQGLSRMAALVLDSLMP